MALGLTSLFNGNAGSINFVTGIIAFDSSYPTGGEALTPANLGLSTIQFLVAHPTKGVAFEYDYTNQKLMAYAQGVLVGAAGAIAMDDFPVTAGPGVTASTSVSLASGSATIGLGSLKEVPSTNDMSTVTGVRFFAIGF